MHPDFLLSSYSYHLSEDSIAQEPAPERAASRLMLLDRQSGALSCAVFADLLSLLPKKALLVANNSRVIPARLSGARPGGGKVEMLLLTPLPLLEAAAPENSVDSGLRAAEARMLLRPAKRVKPGDKIRIGDDFFATVEELGAFGNCRVRLCWRGALLPLMEEHGTVPLPPYIKRGGRGAQDAKNRDAERGHDAGRCDDVGRYQTTYAGYDKSGSVAAPTAGLHFTPELLAALAASGREWAELTLYVGYGTFSPVRCQDIREHVMHAEYVEIDEKCAQAVCRAKAEGRPVIAVGSTSARSLEGAFALQGGPTFSAFSGWIDCFIYPGKPFQVIDGLITNFHLPESSLLMLVSALAGRERTLAAYRRALDEGFRFFSYGDAMLIL